MFPGLGPCTARTGSGSSGALVVVTADADQAALLAAASSSYEMGIILEAP